MKNFLKAIMSSAMILPVSTAINNSPSTIRQNFNMNNNVYVYDLYKHNLKPDEIQKSISINIKTICDSFGLKDLENA